MNNTFTKLLSKYSDLAANTGFYTGDKIPQKKIDNMVTTFASGTEKKDIIGIYDTTVFGTAKAGYVFTEDKMIFKEVLSKSKKVWYEEIINLEVTKKDKKKDCDRELLIKMEDGSIITIIDYAVQKTKLKEYLEKAKMKREELNELRYREDCVNLKYEVEKKNIGGMFEGNYETVNKLFEEEKFNARQGHGFAAERANHLYDKLTGKNAKIVGDDNAKNGADRVVDGVEIQTKYCRTGKACVNECFDQNGNFKYIGKDGRPMQIEVPSDKYEEAVTAFADKIKDGKVKGVTDPNEADKIIKKGHFTHGQAKNIAKFGTIESLSYDAVNGIITSTSVFGISASITFATALWNGEEMDIALKQAVVSGIKVGGTTFITSVLASQLSKAGLNSLLVGSSEALATMMGPKVSAMIINAFRDGANIYGAAAMKSLAKLLRGNVIVAGVTVVVLSSSDIASIFSGKISAKQMFKNLTNTASTVAGGTGGWVAGATIGSIVPGVGTVVGGIIGSVVCGSVASKATGKVLDKFIEDDAKEMLRIIQERFGVFAESYLLTKKEAEKSVDDLKEKLTGKFLKEMFKSDNRNKFVDDTLTPIVEKHVKMRKKIKMPNSELMNKALIEVLEECANQIEE